jgi:hypothetical protein
LTMDFMFNFWESVGEPKLPSFGNIIIIIIITLQAGIFVNKECLWNLFMCYWSEFWMWQTWICGASQMQEAINQSVCVCESGDEESRVVALIEGVTVEVFWLQRLVWLQG